MTRQLRLPLRNAGAHAEEAASRLGLELRIDGRTVVSIREVPTGWECHSLAASYRKVILVALPANEAAQRRLREDGIERPVQRGPHPDWNMDVSKRLDRLQTELNTTGLKKGTDAYNHEARKLIERLENELREELKTYKKITEGEAGEDGNVE